MVIAALILFAATVVSWFVLPGGAEVSQLEAPSHGVFEQAASS
jgi:hypothetical protein